MMDYLLIVNSSHEVEDRFLLPRVNQVLGLTELDIASRVFEKHSSATQQEKVKDQAQKAVLAGQRGG